MKVIQCIRLLYTRLRVRGKKHQLNFDRIGVFFYSRYEIHSHGARNLRTDLEMEVRGCVWFESAAEEVRDNRAGAAAAAAWCSLEVSPRLRRSFAALSSRSLRSGAVPSAMMAIT